MIRERDSVNNHLRANFKKVIHVPKTSPNYLHYKIHKRRQLSWIHFIAIIRVTTFECFKMQMVINLAQVSLSNKKVNFYTCPRLTFLKKNATESALKSIPEPLDFKMFWGQTPPSGSRIQRSRLASSCSEVWLRPDFSLSAVTTNNVIWIIVFELFGQVFKDCVPFRLDFEGAKLNLKKKNRFNHEIIVFDQLSLLQHQILMLSQG